MALTTVNDLVISLLNRENAQSLTSSQVTTVRYNQIASGVSFYVTGTNNTLGRRYGTYGKIALSSLTGLTAQLKLLGAPTLYQLLPQLVRATGVALSQDDVQDATVTTNGDASSVVVSAKPTSLRYSGSVTVNYGKLGIDLTSVWTTTALTRTSVLQGASDLVALINTTNQTTVDPTAVSVGNPVVLSGTPNTQVTITGLSSHGYSGTVTVTYNRDNIENVVGIPGLASNTAYTGSLLTMIDTYDANRYNTIPRADIVDQTVTFNGTTSTTTVVQISANSYTYTGTFTYQLYAGSPAQVVRVRFAGVTVLAKEDPVLYIRGVYLNVLTKGA